MLATRWCQGNCQVYPWGKWEQYIIHIFLYFGSFIYWFSTQRCQSSFFSKMLSNIPSLLVPAFAKSFWAWYRWDENCIPFENKSFKYVHLKKKKFRAFKHTKKKLWCCHSVLQRSCCKSMKSYVLFYSYHFFFHIHFVRCQCMEHQAF